MRYMWKFFLLLMLVVTSCSEKQIDGNVINVAEAMSRLSEGQSVQNLFSSISYIPLETNEQAIIGKAVIYHPTLSRVGITYVYN